MKKRIKIHVRQRDIKNAKHNDGARCPVARAIRRTFKGKEISVDSY